MSLLTHNELIELINNGVIDAPLSAVNGASIEITLADGILVERDAGPTIVDIANKQNICTTAWNGNYNLVPGEFILASSVERFNLPNDIVAEYVLKSSMARNGLNHMLAGYCDPGWADSQLTLELKNETRFHTILLRPGMKIGQMKFYRVSPVPEHASYATTGQYNGQNGATGAGALR
jgi:dCTP deaminase